MRGISVVICGAVLAGLSSICYAYGLPDYKPDGPHPRIYLTAPVLEKLNQKQAANDPDCLALIAWCDSKINTPGYELGDHKWPGGGYRGSEYNTFLINFSLGYQILKDDNPAKAKTYADYARLILAGMLEGFSVGEEVNGIGMIRVGQDTDWTINSAEAVALGYPTSYVHSYKNGYSARNYGMAIPLAFDWLYDQLTAQEKDNYSKLMYRFIDWYEGKRSVYNNGVLVGGIRYFEDKDGACTPPNDCSIGSATATGNDYRKVGANFFGGYYGMAALSSVAAYGEQPLADSDRFLNLSRNTIFGSLVAPALANPLQFKGGDSPEGWQYASGFSFIINSLLGMQTATGEKIYNDSFVWPKEFISSYMQATTSNLSQMYLHGEWTGSFVGLPYEWNVLSITSILRENYPSDDISKYSQYFMNNATLALKANAWERLVWKDETGAELAVTGMPLSYRSIGSGLVTMRSTWENSPDSVFGAVQLGAKIELDHEIYDEGTIFVQRGGDRLLTHQNMQRYAVSMNTVVFHEADFYGKMPLAKTAIDRHADTGEYVYTRGDITPAWKDQYKIARANLFYRSHVFIRPNVFVVFDATQANPAFGNDKDWMTQYEADPQVDSANRILTVQKGSSKAFVRTLHPGTDGAADAGSFTKTNPSTGFWRVKYEPYTAQEYDQFLHVIDVDGTQAASMTPVAKVVAQAGTMIGAHIEGQETDYIVMFGADRDGKDVPGTVSYSLPSAPLNRARHLLFSMPPSTKFAVTCVGGKDVTVTPDAGGAFSSSDQGVLEITVAKPMEGFRMTK